MPTKTESAALRALQELPGVGPSIAGDLWRLGVRAPEDLIGRDPDALYERLCEVQGQHIDRCMLYVFRCISYFVNETKHEPEKLKWWNWAGDRRSRPPAKPVKGLRQGRTG